MKTFTLRGPDGMAEQLSSATMRTWLEDFLRNPHALPPDPGSGYERVSLTLPESVVMSVASRCGSGVSSTLRRISAERLRYRDIERHGVSNAAASLSGFAPLLGLCVVLAILLLVLWLQVRLWRGTNRKDRARPMLTGTT
jgi:hypothetical protein